MEEFKYRFITEQGERELTHEEFLKDETLRAMVGIVAKRIKGRVRLFLGRTIISYPVDYLRQNPKLSESFQLLAKEQQNNPLRFYCPTQGAVRDFINDFEHDFCGLFAPNRIGKTTANCIKMLIACAKCDPKWEIFTEHGINYREYEGKKNIGIYSYFMSNLQDTVWPQVVRKWTPRSLLGDYAEGGNKAISWRGQPQADLKDFYAYFKAASQNQGVFESQAMDGWLWDEQGVEANFDGANERTRTTDGRHDAAATPHKIKGRPDTGAHSWMCKMARGEMTKGLNPKFYHASIDDVVDWVYPQEKKNSAYEQWVAEPLRRGDDNAMREGRARYFGEPHQSSGLVIDNFDKKFHLIDPFEIPEQWTKFRSVDHGRVNPEAMLNLAMAPEGHMVLYQEYYKGGLDVSTNVQNIVRICGNELMDMDSYVMINDGIRRRRKQERWVKQKFAKTVLDSRSFAKKLENMQMTLGKYYQLSGLNCIPASGQETQFSVPIVNDWFKIDPEKTNPFTGEKGASRIYVFRTLKNFIWEIMNWIYEEHQSRGAEDSHNPKETPRKKDDHLMTCLLYLAGIPPRYIEGACELEDWDDLKKGRQRIKKKVIDKYTGY